LIIAVYGHAWSDYYHIWKVEDAARFEQEAKDEARKVAINQRAWAERKREENARELTRMESKVKRITPLRPCGLGKDARTKAWAEKKMKKEAQRLNRPRGASERLMKKMI